MCEIRRDGWGWALLHYLQFHNRYPFFPLFIYIYSYLPYCFSIPSFSLFLSLFLFHSFSFSPPSVSFPLFFIVSHHIYVSFPPLGDVIILIFSHLKSTIDWLYFHREWLSSPILVVNWHVASWRVIGKESWSNEDMIIWFEWRDYSAVIPAEKKKSMETLKLALAISEEMKIKLTR